MIAMGILMNERMVLGMNRVNVKKQKQKQYTRNLGLRYCENKIHKMLIENLALKNGFYACICICFISWWIWLVTLGS